jgi:hypothetical protein
MSTHTATRSYVFGKLVLLTGNDADGWEIFNFITGAKVGATHRTYQQAALSAKQLAKTINARFL